MTTFPARLVQALAIAALAGTAVAQPTADIDFKSVGRGASLAVSLPTRLNPEGTSIEAYPPAEIAGLPEHHWMVGPFRHFVTDSDGKEVERRGGSAWNGAAPPGRKATPTTWRSPEAIACLSWRTGACWSGTSPCATP